MIPLQDFLELPVQDIATLVRQPGPQVCVFPINGTRRWFMLEHAHKAGDDPIAAYLDISSQNHIALYRLFFDHGIDTLLTPTLGPDILLRGDDYMQQIGVVGLARLANGDDFLSFYDEYDVRVHFYGDYRKALSASPHAHLADIFDTVAERTKHHKKHRLFFGVFGNDATEAVAEFSVRYFQEHGQIPDKHAIIESYYGEYVNPATLFIGFDKFSAFDYPLLASGEEDLYFTAAPSPYMTDKQLRTILYDHLYTRRVEEPDYATISPDELSWMKTYYQTNQNNVFGVGSLRSQVWYPLPQIK